MTDTRSSTPPASLPPQDKLTQQQAGRAITSKSGGHSTKERHNLVVDLGNHAQETITDMQRAFVQVWCVAILQRSDVNAMKIHEKGKHVQLSGKLSHAGTVLD